MHSPTWEAVETISREGMEQLQVVRLQACLANVKEQVSFYRNQLSGANPEDIRSLGDLSRLPFTTKQDLRDNYPFDLFAKPMSEVVRVHASSGTTGKPTVVGYTSNDIDMWAGVALSLIHI